MWEREGEKCWKGREEMVELKGREEKERAIGCKGNGREGETCG